MHEQLVTPAFKACETVNTCCARKILWQLRVCYSDSFLHCVAFTFEYNSEDFNFAIDSSIILLRIRLYNIQSISFCLIYKISETALACKRAWCEAIGEVTSMFIHISFILSNLCFQALLKFVS